MEPEMTKPAPFRWPCSIVPSLLAAAVFAAGCTERGPLGPEGDPADVQAIVDSIRAAYDLPALGGAIVTADERIRDRRVRRAPCAGRRGRHAERPLAPRVEFQGVHGDARGDGGGPGRDRVDDDAGGSVSGAGADHARGVSRRDVARPARAPRRRSGESGPAVRLGPDPRRWNSRARRDEGLRYAREQRLRLIRELGPGHADDAEAGSRERRIPSAVGLERGARGVERVAVDLDDEPLRAPEEIDFVSAHDDVRFRLAESRLADQREEPGFRFGARERGPRAGQEGRQPSRAGSAWAAGQEPL